MDGPPPVEALDWQGQPWTPEVHREGGASELALHHPCAPMPIDLAGMGKPERGTDLGDSVRWPSRQSYPVDLPVVQLATRRVPGGQYGVRDHGGGHRRRGRGPA